MTAKSSKETVAVIIPSRYASTRFPAKALAPLCGRPMVQHVVEKATASQADLVLVATDHELIRDAVESFGGRAVMTAVPTLTACTVPSMSTVATFSLALS